MNDNEIKYPCENCDIRKDYARRFDLHWHGEDDCPYVCPFVKEKEKVNDR